LIITSQSTFCHATWTQASYHIRTVARFLQFVALCVKEGCVQLISKCLVDVTPCAISHKISRKIGKI